MAGFLTDIGKNLSNLWNSGTQAVGNEVHQLPQQISNVAQHNPVSNYFNPDTSGQNGFWSDKNPIATTLAGQTQLPQFHFQAPDLHNSFLNFGANLGTGVVNGLANTPHDLVQAPINVARDINSKAPLQKTIADAAPFASAMLNVGTLGGAGVAASVGKEGVEQGLKQGVLNGIQQGGGFGALYGLLQGLATGGNAKSAGDYAKNLAGNTIGGAVSGGVTGGALGGATGLIGQVRSGLTNMLMEKHGMTPEQADKAVSAWARDAQGKFTGGKPKASPVYASDVPGNEPFGGVKVSGNGKQQIVTNDLNQAVKDILGKAQDGHIDFSAPIGGGEPPSPQLQERKFVTSVKESPEVSPQVQGQVEGNYAVKPNQVLKDQSANLLNTQGLDKATNQVLGQLSEKGKGVIPDQAVSDAISVAKAHDAAGNFDQASQIYDGLAQKLTEAGRSVQAASLLSQRTPEGLLYSAQKTLKGAGVPFEGQVKDTIQGLISGVKGTQPGSADNQVATQQLIHYVNSQIPRSAGKTALGIWRAGLLTGPETVAKVGVSHAITTPFELISQIPAELHDRMASLLTGERGVTATMKGGGSGIVSGVKAMGTKLTTGIDMPNTGGFEETMGGGTKQTGYENLVNNIHGSLPKPAYSARYNISLNDQALTAATNQGLKGAEKAAFVKDFVANPDTRAVQLAKNDAEIATNQQKSLLGGVAGDMQKKLGPVGTIIAPFTRIPSAIGVNGLWNYTPFGYGSQIAKQIQSGVLDQRALSQAFGRSATGTSIAALGALLAYNGLMTLKAPADAKEKALNDLQDKPPNSINVGGHWLSLNALGPVGIVLGLGGGFGNALKSDPQNIAGAAEQAMASGGKILLDQPYLKGISGVGNALNDPARYGQTLFNNTAGSIIPAASSQIARGMDTVQRVFPNNLGDKYKAEVPGLAQTLPATHDLFGQTTPGSNPNGTIPGAISGTVNPFYPSTAKSDPVTSELQRLYGSVGSSASPSIGQPTANQTINGVKTKLDPQQLQSLIATEGPQIKEKLGSLIQDPGYQALSDEEKANAINSVLTATHKQVNGTINLSGGGAQTPANSPTISSGTKQFTIINPDTGAVKTIDLSKPITPPVSTGNTELDKKLVTSYNSALSSRATDIVTLYKNGKIDAPTAEKYLEDLSSGKIAGAKKAAKVSIKSASAAKFTPFKAIPIKLGTSKTNKIASALKQIKQPKLGGARVASGGKSFKISNPRVYLSSSGSSQRGIRKAAGVSIPVSRRRAPVLSV